MFFFGWIIACSESGHYLVSFFLSLNASNITTAPSHADISIHLIESNEEMLYIIKNNNI